MLNSFKRKQRNTQSTNSGIWRTINNLRKKLKEKYDEFEQQKLDTLEDHKQLFTLQRKLNFYETDFQIEREEKEQKK